MMGQLAHSSEHAVHACVIIPSYPRLESLLDNGRNERVEEFKVLQPIYCWKFTRNRCHRLVDYFLACEETSK